MKNGISFTFVSGKTIGDLETGIQDRVDCDDGADRSFAGGAEVRGIGQPDDLRVEALPAGNVIGGGGREPRDPVFAAHVQLVRAE